MIAQRMHPKPKAALVLPPLPSATAPPPAWISEETRAHEGTMAIQGVTVQFWLRGVPWPTVPDERRLHRNGGKPRPQTIRQVVFSFAVGLMPGLRPRALEPAPALPKRPPPRKHLAVIPDTAHAPMGPAERQALARVTPRRSLSSVERAELESLRPQTRADCVNGIRPCPWVGCKFHLYLDVHPNSGALKLNHPGLEPDEIGETCALDVADRGPALSPDIGRYLNVTPERAQQIEATATARVRDRLRCSPSK